MQYQVYHIAELEKLTKPIEVDTFICFDTQEDRSFNALRKLRERGGVADVLILSFAPSLSESSHTVEVCKESGIKLSTIALEKDLYCDIRPCLAKINQLIQSKETVGIDISCMPIPFIAQILHYLLEYHQEKMINIYYTEPLRYTLQNLFDYSSYSGEIDFKAVRGFDGETSQSSEVKRVLFYLMGFEMKYLNNRIPQDVAPDEIVPINGFPSYFPKYKDISLINDGTDFYEQDIEIIFAEANNPFEVYNTLVTLESKYKDFRIDIIPVGTKPMALGACLYALKNGNNKCRIIFPFPSDYTPNQNRGCGTLWEYRIQ